MDRSGSIVRVEQPKKIAWSYRWRHCPRPKVGVCSPVDTAQHPRRVDNLIIIIVIIFYVLLTVHLSIFILVTNQLDAQNSFDNKFISCLYMFRAHSSTWCSKHVET